MAVGVDCQRSNVRVRQAVIDERPVVAIVRRAINAASLKCASEDVSAGINCQRDDERKFQAVVDRSPTISIVRRSKSSVKRSGKDVTGRIDCQRTNIGGG